jgi:DtxR family Mn-dependent transcriptional regulator
MADSAVTRHSPHHYLAEAFRIAYYQGDEQYISTSALAEALGVSAPAVTRMVGRLKESGYLEHEPYRGVSLTEAGRHVALADIRRHRLIEVFLVNVLGMGWHEVHDDADALADVVSEDLLARIDDMAGNPRRCPHGEPIPTADGKIARVVDAPLNEQPPGVEYAVSRVNTHDADRLRYLAELGLRPGTVFTLVSRAPFNGPLELLHNGKAIVIGHELAGVLRVCPPEAF